MLVGCLGFLFEPRLFWVGIGAFYVGILILVYDLYQENLEKPIKIVIGIGLGCLAAIVSWAIVIVPAPLRIMVDFSSHKQLSSGSSDPDGLIADAYLERGGSGESVSATIESLNLLTSRSFTAQDPSGQTVDIPNKLLASTAGYKVRCERLLPKQEIHVVMAVVAFRKDIKNPYIGPGPNDRSVLIVDDHGQIVYGLPGANIFADRPTKMDFVEVDGDYIAAFRRRTTEGEHKQIPGEEHFIGKAELSPN